MQRGVIKLNNLELEELCALVNFSEYFLENLGVKESLLVKISPVGENEDRDQVYDIFINENEAEAILDSMPIPGKDNSLSLASSRIKIQHFLDKKFTSL